MSENGLVEVYSVGGLKCRRMVFRRFEVSENGLSEV